MTDPKRWSEDGDASQQERELLLAGQAPSMPDSERRALWASIALSLPAATPSSPPAAHASLAGSAGLAGYLTKGLIFLAAVGGLGFGVSRLWPRSEVATPTTAPALQTRESSSATREPILEATAPAASVASREAPEARSEAKRVTTTSQLREESIAVLQARAALRAGNASQTLALLEQARQRFPRGALGQEREALTIEALAQSGQSVAAQRRAEAFLRAHPGSPYVADLRHIAQP
jgi:hypothetical protein